MPDPVAELAELGRKLSSGLLSDEAWTQEIERGVAAHERGEGSLHELDDVMAEARRLAP